jgi:type III pantothenate kinase
MKGGFFEGERLCQPFRISLARDEEPASWKADLDVHLRGRRVTRVGLTSVVPAATPLVATRVERLTGIPAEVIHHRMRLPFSLAYETPHTLGADRLAAAAAAWVRYGQSETQTPRAVVALDAGTAVTCEVVDRAGVFRGGTIGAGPHLIREALARGTAQLPAVPLNLPPTPIGRSTQEALQAGIMYAFLDSVRGMLARIRDALGEQPFVVATGGWSDLLKTHLDAVDHTDPHLVLHGIRVLMTLNEAP